MWSRVLSGLAALCFGLAALSAAAATSSRIGSFVLACDGSNKTVTLNATGFPAGIPVLVIGGEVALFENRGGLQYVMLRIAADPQKQLVTLSSADNRVQTMLGDYAFNMTSNPAGNIPFSIDGACNGGYGQIQGLVTIWFWS
jgi:hypothetical protein